MEILELTDVNNDTCKCKLFVYHKCNTRCKAYITSPQALERQSTVYKLHVI